MIAHHLFAHHTNFLALGEKCIGSKLTEPQH